MLRLADPPVIAEIYDTRTNDIVILWIMIWLYNYFSSFALLSNHDPENIYISLFIIFICNVFCNSWGESN
jgi:hypothetical protein